MKPTIKDVAQASGISVATVSMALNNRSGVSEATRKKVLRVAREMNYVPNYSARSLVMQDSSCIGLMVPEIQNPFYSAIVDIMTCIAQDRGYTLSLGITNNSPKQEEIYTRMFLSHGVRGVIVAPMLTHESESGSLDLLRAANIPIVFCTDDYAESTEPLVMCDYARGEYEATNYLIGRGMRKFCFVSTSMSANFSRLRYEGYIRALREAGIEENGKREMMVYAPRYNYAYEITDRIIDDLPDAVVCINDIMTMAIMKRMNERGIRVPRDVSLMGFDDIMFSELLSPPLTTVRQPIYEICEKSMQILEEKIQSGEYPAERVYLVPPELMIRETTV